MDIDINIDIDNKALTIVLKLRGLIGQDSRAAIGRAIVVRIHT